MQTIILPGKAVSNREWVDLVAVRLTVEGIIRPILWDHWLDSSELFYPKEKAGLIVRHAKGDKLNIIAHSIGTLVASYIVDEASSQINKVIICGIPLHDMTQIEKEEIKKAILSLDKSKVICFQNENDPHASYVEVKEFLGDEVNLILKTGDTHYYPYFEEFDAFLLK